MNKGHGLIISAIAIATITSASSVSAQTSNPFKPKVVQKQEIVVPVVQAPVNPDLSHVQREEVRSMIDKSLSALELKAEGTDSVEVSGEQYVLLKEGDMYLGVSSGMFVTYSPDRTDGDPYSYFDTQKYLNVLSEKKYTDMIGDAKLRAKKLLGGFVKEEDSKIVAPPESAKKEAAVTPSIKPIKLKN